MTIRINKLVTHLGNILKKHNLSLVTAESCTGGGLAYYISVNPQSSAALERGYVTYSNQSKEQLLKVKPYCIQLYGAVSKEVAIDMATGALKNSGAQVAIGITGIAGPDKKRKGNTKGTVWMCCASILSRPKVQRVIITGARKAFCDKTIESSLKFLISYLETFE